MAAPELVLVEVLLLLLTFSALAEVTEAYFVPALNVLCETWRIPDDVAGATVMAAGASSPELLAALLARFVTHSDVGVGTVIGSAPFNMLAICGASALASPEPLRLQWRLVARECSLFLLALLLLAATIVDGQVTWWQSALLLACYAVYVVVCATYTSRVVPALCPPSAAESYDPRGPGDLREALLTDAERAPGDTAVAGDETLPPARLAWYESVALARQRVRAYGGHHGGTLGLAYGRVRMHGFLWKKSRFYSKVRLASRKWQRRWFVILESGAVRYSREPLCAPESMRTLDLRYALRVRPLAGCEIEIEAASRRFVLRSPAPLFTCWLDHFTVVVADLLAAQAATEAASMRVGEWVDSTAGAEAAAGVSVQAAGFPIPPLTTGPLRGGAEDAAPNTGAMEVGVAGAAVDTAARDEEEDELEDELSELVHVAGAGDGPGTARDGGLGPDLGGDSARNLSTCAGSTIALARRAGPFVTFPVRAAIRLSVPDIRRGPAPEWRLIATLVSSATWLAVSSLVMVRAAERLGNSLGVPSSVMGLTVGAIGTSVPNAISSVLVARQGLGSMAVSNALGSNVFNILVALGLPWFIQTAFVSRGLAPLAVDNTGVLGITLVLTASLFVFVLALAVLRFSVGRRVGCAMLGAYAVFLVAVMI